MFPKSKVIVPVVGLVFVRAGSKTNRAGAMILAYS